MLGGGRGHLPGACCSRSSTSPARSSAPRPASVFLYDEEADELHVFEAVSGQGGDTLVGARFPSSAGVAGFALVARQPLVVDDLDNDPRFSRAAGGGDGLRPDERSFASPLPPRRADTRASSPSSIARARPASSAASPSSICSRASPPRPRSASTCCSARAARSPRSAAREPASVDWRGWPDFDGGGDQAPRCLEAIKHVLARHRLAPGTAEPPPRARSRLTASGALEAAARRRSAAVRLLPESCFLDKEASSSGPADSSTFRVLARRRWSRGSASCGVLLGASGGSRRRPAPSPCASAPRGRVGPA